MPRLSGANLHSRNSIFNQNTQKNRAINHRLSRIEYQVSIQPSTNHKPRTANKLSFTSTPKSGIILKIWRFSARRRIWRTRNSMLRSKHQILNRNSQTLNRRPDKFDFCRESSTNSPFLRKTNPISKKPQYPLISFLTKGYGKNAKICSEKTNPNKPKANPIFRS